MEETWMEPEQQQISPGEGETVDLAWEEPDQPRNGQGHEEDPGLPRAEGAKGEETFPLKYMDEIRTVNREEVTTLAQKGMDYDRVRSERDQLR